MKRQNRRPAECGRQVSADGLEFSAERGRYGKDESDQEDQGVVCAALAARRRDSRAGRRERRRRQQAGGASEGGNEGNQRDRKTLRATAENFPELIKTMNHPVLRAEEALVRINTINPYGATSGEKDGIQRRGKSSERPGHRQGDAGKRLPSEQGCRDLQEPEPL